MNFDQVSRTAKDIIDRVIAETRKKLLTWHSHYITWKEAMRKSEHERSQSVVQDKRVA